MNVAATFSHRNGQDILESPRFQPAFQEFLGVLRRLPPYRASKPKKTSVQHVIAPGPMNRWLDRELCIERDWDWHPLIIDVDPGSEQASQLRSDYRKARIEVEVQFGNVARYAYDVYKMAIAMALGHSDVGLMVVCTKRFAAITGGNIAYFERAARELEHSRLTLIVPLVVVGIEPATWMTTGYPPEEEAPPATAAMVNTARAKRGASPVPDEPEEEAALSLRDLRRIAASAALGRAESN